MMRDTLRLGDVLVFKAEEKWVSKAIAALTDSDVSHAAMYFGEAEMVEMGLSGIMVSELEIGHGEEAYQLRLAPAMDADPLIQAAQAYVEKKTVYDLPALVLLGGLLVYRHIRPSTQLYRVVDAILNAAVVLLDQLLGQLLRGGDPGMVCSQLVYQVYQDCGEAYCLHMEGGNLQCGVDAAGNPGVCLLDLRLTGMDEDRSFPRMSAKADEEALAKELFMALTADQAKQEPVSLEDGGYLAPAVTTFAELLEQLAQTVQIPLDALLVTPADLAYHTRNLKCVGKVAVKRTG